MRATEFIVEGLAEGLEHADKLSGLVDLPVFPSSTNPRGTAKVVNTGDRIMAVLNVRGVNIPYYISTGGGGKASVPTGKWYPIFGRHSSGWLNKGGEDSINKSYGSNVLALGSSRLNNMLGDLSSMESQIPFMKKSGDAIINRDLQPMSYAEVSANPDEFKKRVNSFLAKLGSPPFYKVNATETQGVAEGKDFDRCFDQACKLYDRAVSKNLEPKLVQVADFQGDGNGADPRWMKLPQHVWQHYVVIVGDQVLDPTAKQFGDTMPTQYQVSDLDRLWGKQYQIRPRQGVAEDN